MAENSKLCNCHGGPNCCIYLARNYKQSAAYIDPTYPWFIQISSKDAEEALKSGVIYAPYISLNLSVENSPFRNLTNDLTKQAAD